VPHRTEDGPEEGTQPPVAKDWKSPFLGKTAEEMAKFLQSAPEEENSLLDMHYFAVLDEDFKKSGLVTIYRIGDEELKGQKLESRRCSVERSTLFLVPMERDAWEETEDNGKSVM